MLARDAAVDVGSVAPKVDGEHRFRVTDAQDAFAELVALLRREHHRSVRAASNRHVEEVPTEDSSPGHQRVDPFVTDQHAPVLAGHGSRVAEHDATLAQQIHRVEDVPVDALAAPRVGRRLVAFEAEHGRDVAELGEPVDDLLIDQGPVREHLEVALLVVRRQVEQAVVEERLTAEERVQVDPHLGAFVDDPLQDLGLEIPARRILAGVAALARQVAAHRRAHEDGRRRPHARSRSDEVLPFGHTAKKSIDDKTFDEAVAALGTELLADVTGDGQGRMVLFHLVTHKADSALVLVGRDALGQLERPHDALLVAARRGLEHLIDDTPLQLAVEAGRSGHDVPPPFSRSRLCPRVATILARYEPGSEGRRTAERTTAALTRLVLAGAAICL